MMRVSSFRARNGLWWQWVCEACKEKHGSWLAGREGVCHDSAREHARKCWAG